MRWCLRLILAIQSFLFFTVGLALVVAGGISAGELFTVWENNDLELAVVAICCLGIQIVKFHFKLQFCLTRGNIDFAWGAWNPYLMHKVLHLDLLLWHPIAGPHHSTGPVWNSCHIFLVC